MKRCKPKSPKKPEKETLPSQEEPPALLHAQFITAGYLRARLVTVGPADNRVTVLRLQLSPGGVTQDCDFTMLDVLALRELCDAVIRNGGITALLTPPYGVRKEP